jgi:hypothetical protein
MVTQPQFQVSDSFKGAQRKFTKADEITTCRGIQSHSLAVSLVLYRIEL